MSRVTLCCKRETFGNLISLDDSFSDPTGGNVCFKPEGSGFTHAYNEEPVTFHPDYAHKGDVPVR